MVALEHGVSSQDAIKTMNNLISSTLKKEPRRLDEVMGDDVLLGLPRKATDKFSHRRAIRIVQKIGLRIRQTKNEFAL